MLRLPPSRLPVFLPPFLLLSFLSLPLSSLPLLFFSVSVTTSLNINQTGVGGGEQGTP